MKEKKKKKAKAQNLSGILMRRGSTASENVSRCTAGVTGAEHGLVVNHPSPTLYHRFGQKRSRNKCHNWCRLHTVMEGGVGGLK